MEPSSPLMHPLVSPAMVTITAFEPNQMPTMAFAGSVGVTGVMKILPLNSLVLFDNERVVHLKSTGNWVQDCCLHE